MPRTFYVAPAGNDSNTGSLAQPFATPHRAQAAARGYKNASITLRTGSYALPGPLAFGPSDSNQTWAAYPGESPTLSGGYTLPAGAWALHDATKNIYQAYVPGGVRFRQLWVNGVRATRCRTPNTFAQNLAAPAPTNPAWSTWTRTTQGYTTDGFGSTFAHPEDLELVYIMYWEQWRIPVQRITGTTLVADPTSWQAATAVTGGEPLPTTAPVWIEHAYELLTQPGTFYLDVRQSILYYIPRAGENMATATVTVPLLTTLVRASGATGITFDGLALTDTRWDSGAILTQQATLYWDIPYQGTSGAAAPPAAIMLDGAGNQGWELQNCTFERIAANAVTARGGASAITMDRCLFTDIGATAVEIGNYREVNPPTPTSAIVVTNSTIHDCAVEYLSSCGIMGYFAQQCTIAHNLLYNLPYTGLSWGLGWGTLGVTANSDTLIQANEIHDVMQALYDGGGIYLNGTGYRNKLIGNHVHHIHAPFGILYQDNGCTNWFIENNVVHDCTNAVYMYLNEAAPAALNAWMQYNFLDTASATPGGPYNDTGGFNQTQLLQAFVMNQVVSAALAPLTLTSAAGPTPLTPPAPDPTLGVPTLLSLGTISGQQVTLTWQAPHVGTVLSYEIWDGHRCVAVVAAPATTYTFKDLRPSTYYAFTVIARSTAGTLSAPSAPASLWVPGLTVMTYSFGALPIYQ